MQFKCKFKIVDPPGEDGTKHRVYLHTNKVEHEETVHLNVDGQDRVKLHVGGGLFVWSAEEYAWIRMGEWDR